ncbi:hypothetical protein RM02_004070 [Salmonella enterica subsp. enterica]|nr:hypothetical protein [Salmonella enterica subsp. enterica serovar Bispebjerg]ECF6912607.1 hypothetical protein [Salmonella enterica subsp. enterica]ECM3600918.1 hypothetical protein [Salmonella enterica subsp. enterica serovar Senftenberg]EDV5640379.1 hypothetical protein [Salmonella enterica subsp. enterica serovar Salford]EDW1096590.1 hypothetical protein [Salmonella enterica subsp. enterica serovar Miami]EHA9425094.1 hypothetical protein [Salmonella enterica subsp. enterica serovar Typhi
MSGQLNKGRRIRGAFCTLAMAGSSLLLSGCHSLSLSSAWQGPDSRSIDSASAARSPLNTAPTVAPSSGLTQCQEELRSLKGLDETLWQPRQEAFSQAMSKASRYMVLRPRLSGDMQQVMDSIHQAQLARSCQEIHAALFRALLNRADNP